MINSNINGFIYHCGSADWETDIGEVEGRNTEPAGVAETAVCGVDEGGGRFEGG